MALTDQVSAIRILDLPPPGMRAAESGTADARGLEGSSFHSQVLSFEWASPGALTHPKMKAAEAADTRETPNSAEEVASGRELSR